MPWRDIQAFAQKHKAELDGMAFVSADQMLRNPFGSNWRILHPGYPYHIFIPHLIEIARLHRPETRERAAEHFLQMRGILQMKRWHSAMQGMISLCLRQSGTGFAMTNATDECKAAAYAVAEENNADGVAKMIRKYCL